MTFQQILSALWRRWWVILAVALLAGAAAGLYQARQTPTYASSATLRVSTAVSGGTLESMFGTIPVDFDPESVTSAAVLEPAAGLAGEADPSALNGAITWQSVEGTRTDRLVITATALDPDTSQTWANAVAQSYSTYVQGQVETATVTLQGRYDDASAQAAALQQQAAANPNDSVVAANLARALQRVGTLGAQLDAVAVSGAPVTIETQAGPGAPQGTPPATTIGVAVLAGLLAGAGVALTWAKVDTRVRSTSELDAEIDVPLIADLPWDRHLRKRGERLPALSSARTALTEGLRTARTGLQVLGRDKGAAFVITSVEPNDGKTFLAANLAVAWARSGKKVILVAGDLRRPELRAYFATAAEGPGLADLLQRGLDGEELTAEAVESMLNDTDITGLRILPSGADLRDPADYLASDGLHRIISITREDADIVLIDSPPSLALTDAALLAEHATGAVVLYSLGRSERDRIIATVDDLIAKDVNVLGLIANRSDKKVPASYGRYYHSEKHR